MCCRRHLSTVHATLLYKFRSKQFVYIIIVASEVKEKHLRMLSDMNSTVLIDPRGYALYLRCAVRHFIVAFVVFHVQCHIANYTLKTRLVPELKRNTDKR